MAGQCGHSVIASWDEIPMIDRVCKDYDPLKGLYPGRLSRIHSLAYWQYDDYILLLHEQGNKTYVLGRCNKLGLTETCQEREVEELRGRRVVQVTFSELGNAYILTEDGTLWSSGAQSFGQLGRPLIQVPTHRFGTVPIDQAVRQVAAGKCHALAMTEDQVFAFGGNYSGQLGVPGCDFSADPMVAYAGSGPAAPHQVACGYCYSVILTVGGKVLTCGEGGRTGQGHNNHVLEMSEVRGLRDKHVQEVGSTRWCTYALSDGKLFGWGNNYDGALGVGHKSVESEFILEPTPIDCGGHHIVTFRCAGNLVVAVTDNGDCLFWGRDKENVTMSPQLVTGHVLPRDVCGKGKTSGGLVFLDSKENRQRVFPVLHSLERRDEVRRLQDAITKTSATAESRLQKAEADITELRRLIEDGVKRENDNTLQVAETENAELKRLLEASIARENTASEALRQAERDRVSLEGRIDEMKQKILELQMAQQASAERDVHREYAASEALRGAERGRVSLEDIVNELKQNISELRKAQHRDNAASDKFDELQNKVLELQTALQASAERDVRRENLFSGTIRVVEEGRLEQGVEISELRRRIATMQLAQDADVGPATQQQNVHQQRTDSDAKIAELETENRELRLQKRELLAQFRSATVDYRELQMEYSAHLESCGTNPMRAGARLVRQSRRGREERRGPPDPTGARQGRY